MGFKVRTTEFSLKSMCAVKVAHHVLKVSGMTSPMDKSSKKIEKKAAGRVDKLKLPDPLKAMIENLFKPIIGEIDSFGLGVDPVFTPQGTVNTLVSARAILENENHSLGLRFIAACKLCSVRHMLKLGKQLNTNDIEPSLYLNNSCRRFVTWTRRVIVWANNCVGQAGEVIVDPKLLEQLYNEGFGHAIRCQMDATVKCFLNKVSTEMVGPIYDKNVKIFTDVGPLNGLSAATHLLLFSKQCVFHRRKNLWQLSCHVLIAQLNWPNQSLFLETARALLNNLNAVTFWKVLSVVAYKLTSGFKDYNYGDLFVAFWEMGAGFRRNCTIGYHFGILTTHYVFCSDDDRIMDFFLKEITAADKEELLMECLLSDTYVKLFLKRKFGAIERLIRGCCMGDRELLVTLREEVVKWSDNSKPNARHISKQERKWKEGNWKADLQLFTRIVDKIIAEECTPGKVLKA